jgi:hypothetical protein
LQSRSPANHLTPAGADVFTRARTELCFTALAQPLTGRTAADLYDADAGERERLTRQRRHIPVLSRSDHSGAMAAALPELLTWAAIRVGMG